MSAIGVLALQGGFDAHGARLREMGHEVVFVRTPRDLAESDGLVLPGGESTVQRKLLDLASLTERIVAFAREGRPVLATCSGLILSARRVLAYEPDGPIRSSLGLLDVDVVRNAYGRQLDSFEGTDDDARHELVFIRAPRIARVGADVEVLATLSGEPILVRRGRIIGAAFHPELTSDRSIHELAFGAA